MKQAVSAIVLFVVVAALTGWLRQPVIDEAFCDPDLAGAVYSAQELLLGGDLYGDTVETKPPLSYLMFAGLFALFGKSMKVIYLYSALWHLAVAVVLFFLARSILSTGAGVLAAIFYAFFSASNSTNGPCPNFETWTLLPTALGFWFLWRASRGRWHVNLAAAGICAGVSLLAKQNVVVMPLLALPWLWFALEHENEKRAKVRKLIAGVGVATVGALLPIVFAALFFAARGQLGSLWNSLHPGAAVSYMSSEAAIFLWERMRVTGGDFLWQFLPVVPMIGALIAAFAVPLVDKPKASQILGYRLIAVWLVAAFAAVVVGTKFFDHYFILLTPPLAAGAGIGVWALAFRTKWPRAVGVVLIVVTIALVAFAFRWEWRIATKAAVDRVKIGRLQWKEDGDYFWFRSNLPRYMSWSHWLERVGRCTRENTTPADGIYVWDYEPGIYWFADRRAPTKHFMYFNVAVEQPDDQGRWYGDESPQVRRNRAELLAELHAHPPAYIVTYKQAPSGEFRYHRKRPAPFFPALAEWVESFYERDMDCSNLYLQAYRRKKVRHTSEIN
ncbi:MAG: glycosyltransferase family 39 protein [Candidatus Lernaella stagnicola]|nr:glycosyltransferase family 39 protein [Candidatus Lernaella stagnicola]